MKIALDAMGGDFGPPHLVPGAVMALKEYPHINKLFLVGDTAQIEAELNKLDYNDGKIDIVHSTQVVDMSDRAWSAVRRKKDSSVSRAVDLVKYGQADAIVSAGHTGAAVAASMIKLRTLAGIDRPGIAAVLPTETNVFVLVDAGANIDARPEHLLQYAFMGSVYSRHVLGYKNPTVGLISLGEEDVNGICIIAHGASTPLAVKNALRVAAESIEQQVNPHIVEEIRRYHETTTSLAPAAVLR